MNFEVSLVLIGVAIVLSGPAAFVIAYRERNHRRIIEQRLAAMDRALVALLATKSAPSVASGATADETASAAAAQSQSVSPTRPVERTARSIAPPDRASWGLPGEAAPSEAVPQTSAPGTARTRSAEPARETAAAADTVASRTRMEQLVGTSWAVKVGGVALALGGLLLVRYSVEQGFVGPAVRCALAVAFAAALTVAGEWLRRREKARLSPTITPAILTAAATVVAFGAIYAAHGLYGFIGPAPAFVLLGLVAITSIGAAALHGPALAGVGLLGAFAAPLIVTSDQPNPWPVVLYLAVATGAAYVLARVRRWLWLACAASAGALMWAVLFSLDGSSTFFHAALVHVLLSTSLAGLFIAFLPSLAIDDERAVFDPVASVVLGLFALAAVFLLATGIDADLFSLRAAALTALLVGGLAVLSALTASSAASLPIAGGVALALLWLWPGEPDKPVFLSTIVTLTEPRQPTPFSVFALFAALCVGAIGARRMLVSRTFDLRLVGLFASATVVTPLLVLAVTWLRLAHSERSLPFLAIAGLLAAAFAVLAHQVRDGAGVTAPAHRRIALGSFATGALAALSLGLVMVLDGGMLTVALALSALAAAAVSARLDIGGLRLAVAAMSFVVLGRLAWNPRIVGDALGTRPVLNWLLIGYGVPAAAFGYAARLLRLSRDEDLPVRVAQSLAVVFSALLVFFEIRHALHGGDVFAQRSGLVEQGLDATMALLFSLTLVRLHVRRAAPVFDIGSIVFALMSAPIVILGLLALHNPLFSCEPLRGGQIVNTLVLGYALPALAAAGLARAASGVRPIWFVRAASAMSLALLFTFASLETRRLFHGPTICLREGFGQTEIWAYSAVWIALGFVILLYGIAWRRQEARWASAAFVLAATLKIFLYDLSALEGFARAFSFIGLGLALIGIGLLYQKFVFRTGSVPPSDGRGMSPETTSGG